MKKIIGLLFIAPLVCFAQEQNGIKFETELKSWQEVLAKAKQENKYIFIDCFTTWCGPCKVMDKDVYSSKETGDYFNSKFLSIKVQMDRTDKDDDYTKNWYGDAAFIEKSFNVVAFPTFVFLAPDGKPMHKATGLLNPQAFIALAKDAQNPDKQYYRMLAEFKPGEMDTAEMKGIARALKYSGSELAKKIVTDYLNRIPSSSLYTKDNLRLLRDFRETEKSQEVALSYIKSLPAEKLFTNDNIEFVGDFIQDSRTIPFKIFYANAERINRIMRDGDYVQSRVAWIITKEEFYTPI
jgi:thioredoxin-related protein